MNDQVRQWLDEQQAQQRQLLLIIDSLAEPSPIQELFVSDLMQDYINLYHGTEFADLADIGPWLVAVSASEVAQIQPMLDAPERNWGWLASADRIDLTALAQHWRERMQVDEKGQRSLYRFQDSRVIARHLAELAPAQQPLLLGPLNSALCWDGECWQCFDNARPGQYPAPFEAAWLTLPEPDTVVREIQRHNLTLWLWQQHPTLTAKLAERVVLDAWLNEQLNQAELWQWHSPEQQRFLLQYRLNLVLVAHSFWTPRPVESPEQHFLRCQAFFTNLECPRA
ncbi:DUF4123 domain-containing protein [Pseudomonas sp. CBC3]|uniref:DUF4123 domain-containing protein n=1 Tax=Pseudomonas sp. CBC3 TaxID=3123318 RepID=UPI0030E78989